MKKIKFYVLSLCVHIFLFFVIGAFTLGDREMRQVPVIWEFAGHLDIATDSKPEAMAVNPQSASAKKRNDSADRRRDGPKSAKPVRKLNRISEPAIRPMALGAKSDSANINALQEELPQSIMFAKRPNLTKALGLERRIENSFFLDNKMSAENVRAQRLPPLNTTYQRQTENWRHRILGTAAEAAAFYAAKGADKPVAMVAVATYAFTVGSVGKSIRAMGKALRRSTKTPRGLHLDDREIDIMEQIWVHEKASVRDLYLALSSGWTVQTLKKKLENLVDRGLLVDCGKGYTARVDPSRVMNAMVADLGSEDVKARIFRLAEIRSAGLEQ